jgi:hypothetical protein
MMFLNNRRSGYNRHGEQTASGDFLILFSSSPGGEIRACARFTRLHQFGHFMMGTVRIGKHRASISGAYGQDGLTKDPEKYPGVWEKLLPVPQDLAKIFWKGDGWNSAGKEAPDMHKWALDNLVKLKKAGR